MLDLQCVGTSQDSGGPAEVSVGPLGWEWFKWIWGGSPGSGFSGEENLDPLTEKVLLLLLWMT